MLVSDEYGFSGKPVAVLCMGLISSLELLEELDDDLPKGSDISA